MGRMATTPTPETGADQGRRRRFRPALAERVLIGLILGIAAGVFFGEMAHALKIVGDAFIMLLQVAVIPYIVASLITALGRLTLDDAKKLGLKAGGVLLVLWGIGVAVLLLTPLAFPDWPSASFFSTSQVEEAKPVDFLKLYIPANPFASLANAVMPAIVVFSALIGIALITVKNKQSVLEPLSAIAEALMAVTGFVARLAPYGVFALAASAAGTLDLEEIDRLQVYAIVYMTMAIILSFWVLPESAISTTTFPPHSSIPRDSWQGSTSSWCTALPGAWGCRSSCCRCRARARRMRRTFSMPGCAISMRRLWPSRRGAWRRSP